MSTIARVEFEQGDQVDRVATDLLGHEEAVVARPPRILQAAPRILSVVGIGSHLAALYSGRCGDVNEGNRP
jgi:hypothetical protein